MRLFRCVKKFAKNLEKNVIYPLTYTAVYAIIVSGGRYKIKAPDRKR
nr:MAG TPA: hypothetical protein [Caudoviricetes sp.]